MRNCDAVKLHNDVKIFQEARQSAAALQGISEPKTFYAAAGVKAWFDQRHAYTDSAQRFWRAILNRWFIWLRKTGAS
jgi:hypothetical protein